MTYVDRILSQMPDVFKPQKKAIIALLGALMCFSGRATMRNLSRYGAGSEKRLRRWAHQEFDFLMFNSRLLSRHGVIERELLGVSKETGPRQLIVIDATFLRKSGTETEGLGHFHNGSSRAIQKLERGLEMNLIGVVNLEENSAYALSMHQSVTKSALQVAQEKLCEKNEELQQLSRHVVADGYYARKGFVSTLVDEGFELITLLRHDATLRYLYQGVYSGRGRPQRYAGRVDYKDLSSFQHHEDLRDGYEVYSKIVNYAAWGRDLLVVIKVDRHGRRRVLCCTDLTLSAEEVLRCYEARFQIEFLFRDAKQHTGLGHAQVLDSTVKSNSRTTLWSRLISFVLRIGAGLCLKVYR